MKKLTWIGIYIIMLLLSTNLYAQTKPASFTFYKEGKSKPFPIKSGTHFTVFSKENADTQLNIQVSKYIHGEFTNFADYANDTSKTLVVTHYIHGPLVELTDKYLVVDAIKNQTNFAHGDTFTSIIKVSKFENQHFRTYIPLNQINHFHAEVPAVNFMKNMAIISAVSLLFVAPINAMTASESNNLQAYRSIAIPSAIGCLIFVPLYYKFEYRNFSVFKN